MVEVGAALKTKRVRDILADTQREVTMAAVGGAFASTQMPGAAIAVATVATAVSAPVAYEAWRRRAGKPLHGHSISRMALDLQLLDGRSTRLFARAQHVTFHERTSLIKLGYQSWGHGQPPPEVLANGDFELVAEPMAKNQLALSAGFTEPMEPNETMLIAWTATLKDDPNPDDVFLALDSSIPPWSLRPKLDMVITWDGSSRPDLSQLTAKRFKSYGACHFANEKSIDELKAADLMPAANGQGLRWSVTPRNGQYYRISV